MSCNVIQRIDIQGHRGCRGLLPENTLPAFEKAIDLGVNTLELDIAITKGKRVVVSHEPFMSKTICTKPNGLEISEKEDMYFNLYEMTHNMIKQFDCGMRFHPRFPKQEKLKAYKPLLEEVFELVKTKQKQVRFNIEIKSKPEYYDIYTPQPKEYVSIVLEEIKTAGFEADVNLQSFDLKILREIRQQSPTMSIALLVDEGESIKEKLRALKVKKQPNIISPYFKLLDENTVRNLQKDKFKVIPWTINSEEDMQQLINWGVDGIITDYPNKLINLMRKD